MAHGADKNFAIKLRKQGKSYSQIKAELGVSKSTLSLWLRDLPLSEKRLRELRDFSQIRIEKTRATKLLKKQTRRKSVYKKVAEDIESTKDKEFFAGFYLYWGEGTKTAEYTVALTSSDTAIIACFIKWLQMLGVSKEDMRVKLHVYSDQNVAERIAFWSDATGLSSAQFYKPYVKNSLLSNMTYKGMFGNGTCTVLYHNRDVYEYVMAGIQYLRDRNVFSPSTRT